MGNLLKEVVVTTECKCCGIKSRRVGIIVGENIDGYIDKPVAYQVSFNGIMSARDCGTFKSGEVKFLPTKEELIK